MLTVEQIKQTAADAAAGNRKQLAAFRVLAIFAGLVGRPGGWIYLPGASKPIGHGWRAAAAFVADALTPRAGDLLVEMSKASCSPADIALDFAEALTMNDAHIGRPDNRGLRMGPGHVAPATLAAAWDEAAHREALAICASIPRGGRPAAVTELLTAAELLTDEHEHLAAVRHARAVYDELTSTRPGCDGRMPGHRHCRHGHVDDCPNPGDCEIVTADLRGLPAARSAAAARRNGSSQTLAEDAGRRPDYYAQFPQPRADRLAEIFAAFVEHADSGGPGTSKGLIAAAELATTVTERQLVAVATDMIDRLNSIGLSTPVRVNPHAFANALAAGLKTLGFDVK